MPEGLRVFLNDCLTATSVFPALNAESAPAIVKLGMSPKKQHEVCLLSSLIHQSLEENPVDQVIDFGSGKGYLSEQIALSNPGLSVIGIDREKVNTRGGLERNKLMEKQWRSLYNRLHPSLPPLPREPLNHYEPITMEISSDHIRNDFVAMVAAESQHVQGTRSTMLIGLHACGDLTSVLLHTFLKCPSLQSVVSIGCCYHLITQKEPADYFLSPGEHKSKLSAPESVHAFPMSKFLQGNPVSFTRNALNLAQQAPERMASTGALPAANLFYRAIFQVLLSENFPGPVPMNVGHSATKATNFLDYTRAALTKLQLTSETLTDEAIAASEERFDATDHRKLVVFYQLRTVLSRVIEYVVLIDRLLYLHDNDVSASLIRVFDPIISPRCYAIVAHK
eukprot:sb/3465475/